MSSLKILHMDSHSPYRNLAIEEYIMSEQIDEEIWLLLWQNDNSVIVGYNQSPYLQCNPVALKKYSTSVVRRITGGGAVYHDLGGLNYSIISSSALISRGMVSDILLDCFTNIGLKPIRDGRNDILVNGYKICGNAYCYDKNRALIHGCILVNSNLDIMQAVLNVSSRKLHGHGIKSVKNRVSNIGYFVKGITVENVSSSLEETVKCRFDDYVIMSENSICMNEDRFNIIQNKYESLEWTYGMRGIIDAEVSSKFNWGEITIEFEIEKYRINNIMIDTDSLYVGVFDDIVNSLIGRDFCKKSILRCLISLNNDNNNNIISDIISMIKKEDIIPEDIHTCMI